VLQQASVVGRLFWDQAVARIHTSAGEGTEKAEVGACLAALRSREMIYQRETSSFAEAKEYLFRHALLREITYEGVLKRLRRVYHGLVADWLLEQAGQRAGEYTGLVADHLLLAGRSEQAVEYLQQAGDRARRLYALQEAVRAYNRVLALLMEAGDYDRAARTLMKLGLTHHTAFEFQEARHAYEEGFALWQRAGSAAPDRVPSPPSQTLRLDFLDPQSLDPARATDKGESQIVSQLFSGLVDCTPDLNIVPDVALAWEVLDGGCRYLFHLREDATWSDGAPVTAHDFEYAWRRVLDPATDSPVAGAFYDIKDARAFHEGWGGEPGVRALDDATLEVELVGPVGYFLQLLAREVARPIPRHVVEARGSTWAEPLGLVGNGPFAMASWHCGESMVLERNPRYHGLASGNVQEVRLALLSRKDASALLQRYESGRIDVLELILEDRQSLDRIRRLHAAEFVSLPCTMTYYLVFDVTRPPFDSPKVRQAFAHAVEGTKLVGADAKGLSLPATGGFVPPGLPGYVPGISLPYNPKLARKLLADSGYPGGTGFPAVEMLAFPERPEIWSYLVSQWRTLLGVEVRWINTGWTEYRLRIRAAPPPIYFIGWLGDHPDPDNFLRVAVLLHTPWHHEPYVQVIEQARRTLDQKLRLELYGLAQRILVEEVPILPLTYAGECFLIQPWVKRYPQSAFGNVSWKDVVLETH
jgi:oligopeptide transport system substrate-binding protein